MEEHESKLEVISVEKVDIREYSSKILFLHFTFFNIKASVCLIPKHINTFSRRKTRTAEL